MRARHDSTHDNTRTSTAALREEYTARMSPGMQPFVTYLTGKAARGESAPQFRLSMLVSLALTLSQWPAAVAFSLFTLSRTPVLGFALLPISWLISINALRKAQVVLAHHAVHGEVAATRRMNYWVQVIASSEAFVHNWEDYFDDHVRGHHSRKIFTTDRDPDAALLKELGFGPGRSRRELWLRLLRTVFSTRLHWIFLKARVRTNFVAAPWHRRVAAVLWASLLAAVAIQVPVWMFAVAVLVPLFPLYHVSALLQFISEHAWLVGDGPARTSEEYAARCWGRFCVEPLPLAGLRGLSKVVAWSTWLLRVGFIHIPVRFGVLVGDMPVHDVHHLYPAEHEWRKYFWIRQRKIDEGDSQGLQQREFSNIVEAIDAVFRGLESGLRQ